MKKTVWSLVHLSHGFFRSYFSGGARLRVETSHHRASDLGVGYVKAAGNYANGTQVEDLGRSGTFQDVVVLFCVALGFELLFGFCWFWCFLFNLQTSSWFLKISAEALLSTTEGCQGERRQNSFGFKVDINRSRSGLQCGASYSAMSICWTKSHHLPSNQDIMFLILQVHSIRVSHIRSILLWFTTCLTNSKTSTWKIFWTKIEIDDLWPLAKAFAGGAMLRCRAFLRLRPWPRLRRGCSDEALELMPPGLDRYGEGDAVVKLSVSGAQLKSSRAINNGGWKTGKAINHWKGQRKRKQELKMNPAMKIEFWCKEKWWTLMVCLNCDDEDL